jgi:hypothetical protein
MLHYGGQFDGEGCRQFAYRRTGASCEAPQDSASRRITQRAEGAIQVLVTVFHLGKY